MMTRLFTAIFMFALFLPGCPPRQPEPTKPGPIYTEPPPPPMAACVRSGCSGEVCVEEGQEVLTACIFREEFECLQYTTCERQLNTKCDWTPTPAYLACLEQVGGQ
jgi:eight-cysteine-cluster-containing protein